MNYIITVLGCGLLNGTKLSNFMNYSLCYAHFSKGKNLYFSLKISVSKYTNSTCIHSTILRLCTIYSLCNLRYNIKEKELFKMIPNMNGFIYLLLRPF